MTTHQVVDGIVLENYCRCYVEDFMIRTVSEKLLIMIPIKHHTDKWSKWYTLSNSGVQSTSFEYTNQKNIRLIGVVVNNPMRNQVMSGMQLKDYEEGFGHHNYGYTLDFVSDQQTFSLLLTWGKIIDGRRNDVQVWHSSDCYRDVFTNFADHSKTSHGITALINLLYDEVYGDRLQSLHLIHCFNRAIMKNQDKSIKDYEFTIHNNKPVVLAGEEYNYVLDKYNEIFGAAIRNCYNAFVVIGKPSIDTIEVDGMVCIYKEKLNNHYNAMFLMLGFNKKEGKTRNKHLCLSG